MTCGMKIGTLNVMRAQIAFFVLSTAMVFPLLISAQDSEDTKPTSRPQQSEGEVEKKSREAVNEVLQQSAKRLAEAKSRFIEHSARIISWLEEHKSKLGTNRSLTSEQIATLTGKIDVVLSELRNLSSKIENATTLSDLSSIRESVANTWKRAVILRSTIVGYTLQSRFSRHIIRMEEVSTKLRDKASGLESRGFDVTTISEALVAYEIQLSSASQSIVSAQAIFDSMTTDAEYQQAMKILRNAKGDLQQAGVNLREALKRLQDNIKTHD